MPKRKVTLEVIECVKKLAAQGLPYKVIGEKCGVSVKTAYYIAKGLYEKRGVGDVLNDVELTSKAIELVDEGKVKDPTDLVKHLKITLPQAIELFNAIAEAKKIEAISVIDAVKKLRRFEALPKQVEEVLKNVSEALPKLKEEEVKLEGLLKTSMNIRNDLNKLLGGCRNAINELKNIEDIVKKGEKTAEFLKKYEETFNRVTSKFIEFTFYYRSFLEELKLGLLLKPDCEFVDKDGFCTAIRWSKDAVPENFVTKDLGGGYCQINVKIHKGVCAFCENYTDERMLKLLKDVEELKKGYQSLPETIESHDIRIKSLDNSIKTLDNKLEMLNTRIDLLELRIKQ